MSLTNLVGNIPSITPKKVNNFFTFKPLRDTPESRIRALAAFKQNSGGKSVEGQKMRIGDKIYVVQNDVLIYDSDY